MATLKLRVVVYCLTRDAFREGVQKVVEKETESYLFENGEGVRWTPTNQRDDSLTFEGWLDCCENIENAIVLANALVKVTKEVSETVVRILDVESGTDFLVEETFEDDEDEEDIHSRSAFLFNGTLAIAQKSDPLAVVHLLRQGGSTVRSGMRFVPERLEMFLSRSGPIHRLIEHSKHVVKMRLPFRLAMAVKDPNGALRKLVPLAAFVMAKEDFIDAPLQAVVAAMRSQPSMECLVRFTRLSYATIRANCQRKPNQDFSAAFVEGFARLVRHNDEFEAKYAKYRVALEAKGYFNEVSPHLIAELDARAREKLYGTRSEDSFWVSPRALRDELVLVGSECFVQTESAVLRESDPDDWLLGEDQGSNDGNDNEYAWNRMGEEMKRFVDQATDEDVNGVTSSNSSTIAGNARPVTFSPDQFFKILGDSGG